MRRHWFILLMRLFFIVVSIIVLVAIYFLFLSLNSNFRESPFHNLVIFGVAPHVPATGYGYIKGKRSIVFPAGRQRRKAARDNIFMVEKFLEKPDLKTAKRFVKNGAYF